MLGSSMLRVSPKGGGWVPIFIGFIKTFKFRPPTHPAFVLTLSSVQGKEKIRAQALTKVCSLGCAMHCTWLGLKARPFKGLFKRL